MMWNILSVVFLLWPSYQGGEPNATVTISIVSSSGSALDRDLVTELTLTNLRDQTTFTTTNLVFRNLRFDSYELLMVGKPGSGFGLSRRFVSVRQETVWVVAELPLANMGPTVARLPGRITGRLDDGFKWVKLVSLYSDKVSETPVDSQGRFDFGNVPFGR